MADIDVTLGIDDKSALQALKNIENATRRTQNSFSNLGKIIAGLEIANFIKDTYDYGKANQNMSLASLSAAQAQSNMSKQLDKIRDILLDILKPLNDFVTTIDISKQKVTDFIKIIGYWGLAIAALLTPWNKVYGIIKTIFSYISGSAIAAIGALSIAFQRLFSFDKLRMNFGLLKQAVKDFSDTKLIQGWGAAFSSILSNLTPLISNILIKMAQISAAAVAFGSMITGSTPKPTTQQYGPFEGRIYGEGQDNFDKWEQLKADTIAGMNQQAKIDIDNLKLQNKLTLEQLQLRSRIIGVDEKHIPFMQARLELMQQRDSAINQLLIKRQQLTPTETAAGGMDIIDNQIISLMKEYELQSIRVGDALLKIQIAEKELYNKNRSARQGWLDSWKQFQEDATNQAQIIKDQFNSVISNIDNALDNFVRTGKLSFKDLVRSITQDLASIGLRSAFRQMVSAGGDLFGMHFTGMLGSATSKPQATTVVNNYISAVDSKSVAQLFSDNRKTLLGVTEQAKKELNYRSM